MTAPLKISVVQLTCEPVAELLELARVLDRGSFDVFWLGEAYPWWRSHQMEARSSTSISALVAQATTRVGVGWGIVSPYTRHPIQIAMEARVLQEVAGPDRFHLGLGASRIFMREALDADKPVRPLTAMREATEIIRGVLGGDHFSYQGKEFSAEIPALDPTAPSPRGVPPLHIAATGPKMIKLAGSHGDGIVTASITTPAFTRYAINLMAEGAREAGRNPDDLDVGAVIVASIDEDSDRGKQGAREITGMYLANKVQNIQGAADILLEKADLTFDEIRPVADALNTGGRKACAEAVTDTIFAKAKPIAGNPSECIQAIEAYADAGCKHIWLELWGPKRPHQAHLFNKHVLPHFHQ